MAQDMSVTVNVKTLPGKDAAQKLDKEIEVGINNPTIRPMTVYVVYLPPEDSDFDTPVPEVNDNPWKVKLLKIDGEETRLNTGIKTKNHTLFFVAQDFLGWYINAEKSDTPTVRLSGGVEYHTFPVNLVSKKGFKLPMHPTKTNDEVRRDIERARLAKLLAEQPVGSRLVGVVVERIVDATKSKYNILDVVPNSPAEKYDLHNGDVILFVDKRPFELDDDLEPILERLDRTHKTFNLTISTGKRTSSYQFNPPKAQAPDPDPQDPPAPPKVLVQPGPPTLGVKVRTHRDFAGRNDGAEVVAIVRGSLAETKLKIGDVIKSLLGEPVVTEREFARLEKKLEPGMSVTLRYLSTRNNLLLQQTIDIPAALVEAVSRHVLLGITVRAIPEGGVKVSKVESGSPLDGVLEPGYIIRELNDQPIRSKGDFDRAAQSLKVGQEDISLAYINTTNRPATRHLTRFSVPRE
jgi:S1-C subfamily serine protease